MHLRPILLNCNGYIVDDLHINASKIRSAQVSVQRGAKVIVSDDIVPRAVSVRGLGKLESISTKGLGPDCLGRS